MSLPCHISLCWPAVDCDISWASEILCLNTVKNMERPWLKRYAALLWGDLKDKYDYVRCD